MARSTILAAGNTALTSTDIVVAAGGQVVVGIFAAAADADLPVGQRFVITQQTPGAANKVAFLDINNRATALVGPATYNVQRTAYDGTAFGVFLEA